MKVDYVVFVKDDGYTVRYMFLSPGGFDSTGEGLSRRRSQVAKASDCKSDIVGSTPTGASLFSPHQPLLRGTYLALWWPACQNAFAVNGRFQISVAIK